MDVDATASATATAIPAAAAPAADAKPKFKPIVFDLKDETGKIAVERTTGPKKGGGSAGGAATAAAAGGAAGKEKLCRNCNKPGHFARECKEAKTSGNGSGSSAAGEIVCHTCGKPGHKAKFCTSKSGGEATSNGGGGGGGVGKACYVCSSTGHIAKDCPLGDVKAKKPAPMTGSASSGPRVYIGNLSYTTTWQHLKDFLKGALGPDSVVRCDVMMTGSGKSKGCAIAELSSAAVATQALGLTDRELDGRKLFVREDREESSGAMRQARDNAGSGSGRIGSAAEPGTQLYVGNLSWSVTWQSLKDLFAKHGTVERADVQTMGNGKSKGFGVVRYSNADEAARAIERLHNSDFEGRPLIVRLDKN